MGFSLGSLFKKRATDSSAGPSLGLMYRRGVTRQDIIKHKPKEVSLTKIIQKHLPNYKELIPEKTIKEASKQFKGSTLESEANNILRGNKKISPQQAKTILKQLKDVGVIKTTKNLTKVVDDYVYQAGARQAYIIKKHQQSIAEEINSEKLAATTADTKSSSVKPKLPPLNYDHTTTTVNKTLINNNQAFPSLSRSASMSNNAQPKKTNNPELIKIATAGFSPQSAIIYRGTTVQWQNEDSRPHHLLADPHPIHTDLPDLNSNLLKTDQIYQFTFNQAGVFTYHDELNLQNKGTIIVK